LFLFLAAPLAFGGLFHPHRGTPSPGKPRDIPHTDQRAGFGPCPSCLADYSSTPAHNGYYVGGGSAWHGDPRWREEGTWGWDYIGNHVQRKVWLGWNHGRRMQGGTGSYFADGPQIGTAASPRR